MPTACGSAELGGAEVDSCRPAPITKDPRVSNELSTQRRYDPSVAEPYRPSVPDARAAKSSQNAPTSLPTSASILVRSLFDSHPEITGLPEPNLSALIRHTADVSIRTNEALGTGPEPAEDGTKPSGLTPDVCRRTLMTASGQATGLSGARYDGASTSRLGERT